MIASLISGSAHAHQHIRQVPVPAPSHPALVVAESDQGFAIRAANDGAPCASKAIVTAAATLTLGANLKFDRSIFRGTTPVDLEATDAQPR
jgi:hypothetical protein